MLVKLDVIFAQAEVDIDPVLPFHPAHQAHGDLVEFGSIVARDAFAGDLAFLQDFFADEEDLAGVDRLGEIVVDLAADSLFHQRLLLVLGHHDDRQAGADILEFVERGEAVHAVEHFVEEDQIKVRIAHQFERVLGIGDRSDGIALLFQEQNMRPQQVDLVIDPQNQPFVIRHSASYDV